MGKTVLVMELAENCTRCPFLKGYTDINGSVNIWCGAGGKSPVFDLENHMEKTRCLLQESPDAVIVFAVTEEYKEYYPFCRRSSHSQENNSDKGSFQEIQGAVKGI